MKLLIFILMLLSISILSFKEKDKLNKIINVLLHMDVKRLVYIIGGVYIFLPILLIINAPNDTSIALLIMFIIGCSYVLYARSDHFNKIALIRNVRDLIENTKPYNYLQLSFLCSVEMHCLNKQKKGTQIKELLDNNGNILFLLIDFVLIKAFSLDWANKNIEEESIPYFTSFLEGKTMGRLIHIKSRAKNKELTYRPLFELFDSITFLGIRELSLSQREHFIDLVCQNFVFGDVNITKNNLNPRFSTWRKMP